MFVRGGKAGRWGGWESRYRFNVTPEKWIGINRVSVSHGVGGPRDETTIDGHRG